MEDVLNYSDWPFVNLHCVNVVQYSDYNIILCRLVIPTPLRILPFYVLVCTIISNPSVITTTLLLSHSYHCRALIFSVESEAFSIFCPCQTSHSKAQLICWLEKHSNCHCKGVFSQIQGSEACTCKNCFGKSFVWVLKSWNITISFSHLFNLAL